MSYILDALRRAEADRQRGAVPGLQDQPQPLSAPAAAPADDPRRTGLWALAGAGLLAAGGAAAWWWLKLPGPAPVAPVAVMTPAPAVAPTAPPAPVTPVAPAAAPVPVAPAPAVVSSMQGWRRINFIDEFATAFRVPVFIEQDARAGALAHYLFDPSVHADDNLAYYLVGEGVGLGVIDNGRLINGFLGAATEIGHISIDVNGRPCDCGNVGCLERYCSTPAIHDTLIADGTVVPGAADMTHTEAARALFAKAGDGDEAAIAIVREVARYVGYGCVTIFNGYNPEHIIIGDIVSEAGPILLDEVRATVAERAIPEINASTSISLSTLSADAAVSGAAAVAVTQFLEHPSVFFDVS